MTSFRMLAKAIDRHPYIISSVLTRNFREHEIGALLFMCYVSIFRFFFFWLILETFTERSYLVRKGPRPTPEPWNELCMSY